MSMGRGMITVWRKNVSHTAHGHSLRPTKTIRSQLTWGFSRMIRKWIARSQSGGAVVGVCGAVVRMKV